MLDQFSRTELLLGQDATEKLRKKKVIVFGIGGVGGYAVEALARSGVGRIDLCDDDVVCLTNLNRQLIATRETIGKPKVEIMRERIHSINPHCEVQAFRSFYLPETASQFDFSIYDYVIDAVDTVTAKLSLISEANRLRVPIISAMGAGNKLDPGAFKVSDIYKTAVCPLAKVMRRECKKRGISKLKVVYSEEKPLKPLEIPGSSCREHCICPKGSVHKCTEKRAIPGSVPFVPPVVGFLLAEEVVKDMLI